MNVLPSLVRWNGHPRLWPGAGFCVFALLLSGVSVGMVWALHHLVFVDALREQAELDMVRLDGALEDYRLRTGHEIPAETGLAALLETPPGPPAPARILPRDPWGRDYLCVVAAREDGTRITLRSRGPDPLDPADDVVHPCAPR
ncbi:type II secretion system protein GspG [Luteolibacter sp. LG18]|uniref:type II secretion system protein GspG n=1 Tax=Luteolibacter sp. LG18 TaxID=2819286 RepID=UPI002B2AAA81|nr:hypothetical protein llg_27380 [Luteolibacter sp. LG18]